jgi:hypothetical protein
MASHKQIMVEAASTSDKPKLGNSNTKAIKEMFPASPIYLGEITDADQAKHFQVRVLDAKINDGGHTFGEFDMNYSDAPDMSTVKTGPAGLPASPFVPNPASPPPGSADPADLPVPPAKYGEKAGNTPFTGPGSQMYPSNGSTIISGQKLGSYIKGTSIPGA